MTKKNIKQNETQEECSPDDPRLRPGLTLTEFLIEQYEARSDRQRRKEDIENDA